MGLFSSKPKPEPVRNDVVRNLLKLGMRETDAGDRDLFDDKPSAKFVQAKAEFDKALRGATQAEKIAAFDALRRHGY